MESSVYKNVISTPLRCLIAGRRPGAQLAVNRDRRSRPPAAGSGAERHANRAASTPSRGRRCKASRLDRQNCSVKQSQTARLSPHTAVSKRPGGRRPPRRKTGAARHAKTGFLSELLSQAPATKTTLRMPIIIQPPRRGGRPTPPPAEGRYFSLTLERPPLAPASFQKRYLSARTLRMFYWPADCNLHCPRAGGNRSNNSWLFGRFPTPAVARGGRIYPNRICPRASDSFYIRLTPK